MHTMEGIMYKSPPEHKWWSRWRRRYFVLAGPLLSYRAAQGKNTSRLIDLRGATAELVDLNSSKLSSKGRYEVRVQCHNGKRVYRLRIKSKQTAMEWVVAILNNIKVADARNDSTQAARARKNKEAAKSRSKAGWSAPKEPSRVGEDVAQKPHEAAGEDINSFYKVLSVSPTASGSMIKKRYHELARKYHPDKSKDSDNSRFAEIARAFETLQWAESRKQYDLCERVKTLFRKGVIFTMHDEQQGTSEEVAMFIDSDFKNMYWQDPELGSVLREGYKYIQIRFVHEILAGTDGFECPPGRANNCLTFRGARLGCTLGIDRMCDINLEVDNKQARDDIIDGLRILRCRFSELFKQKLDEMKEEGMR